MSRRKSVEEKLFEAFSKQRGVTLTADDISRLMLKDNAVRVRVSNAAAMEAGVTTPKRDRIAVFRETWRQFKDRIKKEAVDG